MRAIVIQHFPGLLVQTFLQSAEAEHSLWKPKVLLLLENSLGDHGWLLMSDERELMNAVSWIHFHVRLFSCAQWASQKN